MPRRGRRGRGDQGGGGGGGGVYPAVRRGLQRVYGWFRCKQCNRHWESSHVYRVIGTLIVPYRQACKKCTVKAFTGPYYTECIDCLEQYCTCYLDDYDDYDDYYDDDDIDSAEDDSDDGKKRERHNDDRKPHESSLCEKCQKSGRSCR